MNIKDDYLWDKAGEPDPEIQQLEEILGKLRYQPRPLEIPADLQANLHIRREGKFFRGFTPGLAIAATIAMILLFGLWVGWQRLQRHQPTEVAKTPSNPASSGNPNPVGAPSPNQDQNASTSVGPDQKHSETPRRHRLNPSLLAGNTNRSPDAIRKGSAKDLIKDSALAANELQEGAAARDQLMLGLRVASLKINFAQKKAQESTSPRDLIHNQHKIG
jgi:hypothetical protein